MSSNSGMRAQLADLRGVASAKPWAAALVWWIPYILTPLTFILAFFSHTRNAMPHEAALSNTLLVLAAATVIGFAVAFVLIIKSRRLTLMVEARIRSAAQGYTVIRGRAASAGQILTTPYGGQECLWYSYEKSERTLRKGETYYTPIHSEQKGIPFILEDEDGVCLVDPEHAAVSTAEHEYSDEVGMYRYDERYIAEGDELHVMGELRTWYSNRPDHISIESMSAVDWMKKNGKTRPDEGISLMAKPRGFREMLISQRPPADMGRVLGLIALIQFRMATVYLVILMVAYVWQSYF